MENLVTILLPGGTGESTELDVNANLGKTVATAIVDNGIMENRTGWDAMWNKTVVSKDPIDTMGGKTISIVPIPGKGGVTP